VRIAGSTMFSVELAMFLRRVQMHA
jgi:hypothetical protein